MEAYQAKLVAAATGSTLTALTMTPFDVVKTRLQTQPPPPKLLFSRPPANSCCQPIHPCVRNMSSMARALGPSDVVCIWDHGVMRSERVNGFADAIRHVWRAEGVRGLWKGVGTTLLIGVPSTTIYMLTYDQLQNNVLPQLLPSIPTAVLPLFAGIAARTSITSAMTPLELIRTNLQSTPFHANTPNTLRSVLRSMRHAVRQQGPLYLWRGLGTSLWRDVPFSGIYWAGYEAWKRTWASHGYTGAMASFLSGAISGTTAALITSPFDTLKTRRQALVMTAAVGDGSRTATMPLLAEIIRTEGPSALFAGLIPRIAKIAPACGIMIACYEGIGRFLTKPKNDSR